LPSSSTSYITELGSQYIFVFGWTYIRIRGTNSVYASLSRSRSSIAKSGSYLGFKHGFFGALSKVFRYSSYVIDEFNLFLRCSAIIILKILKLLLQHKMDYIYL
jgi:hypothetical protein